MKKMREAGELRIVKEEATMPSDGSFGETACGLLVNSHESAFIGGSNTN